MEKLRLWFALAPGVLCLFSFELSGAEGLRVKYRFTTARLRKAVPYCFPSVIAAQYRARELIVQSVARHVADKFP